MLDEVRDASVVAINGYQWFKSCLQLCYLQNSKETQWMDYQDARIDHPHTAAQYIVDHYKPCSRNEGRDQ
eukprot:931260-Ditylum_brightwellii.AAC.1